MSELKALVETLNSLSPLGIIGLLCYIVYLFVAKKGPMQTLSNNHLSGLPRMEASLDRIAQSLDEIKEGIAYLRGKSDR